MAVTIRLYRLGKKQNPSYRIVATEKRSKRNGLYIDVIGLYNPMEDNFKLEIDDKKLADWVKKGAQMSEGMTKLLKLYKKVYKENNKTVKKD